MSTRWSGVWVALLVVGWAGAGGAQSLRVLSRSKQAATRAAEATNAHTRAMEGDSVITMNEGRSAAGPAPAAAMRDTVPAGASASVAERGGKSEVSLVRESFTYDVDGRRDPFLSLLETGELRPMLSDLRLVAIIYAPAGRSVAILRDLTTKEQYRVRVGQTLGRMRVDRIQPKAVTFTIEEFGFSRQEVLALNDSSSARSQ
jgi:hypothetical protein